MNIPNDCHSCETATELFEVIVVRIELFVKTEMVKSVFQSASLGDYKTELAGNANLLENGSVPSSTENSKRDLGFSGSPKS